MGLGLGLGLPGYPKPKPNPNPNQNTAASTPLDTRGASPYVSRVSLDDDPMAGGRALQLKAQLLPVPSRASGSGSRR